MPHTTSTVRSLRRETDLTIGGDEDAASAMRRIDRAEADAVCRHLLGELQRSEVRR